MSDRVGRIRVTALAAVLTLIATAGPGVVSPRTSQAVPSVDVVNTHVTPGGFVSKNVEWLGNIAVDATGIGARIVKTSKFKRLYVTAVGGLSIYDISEPTIPLLLGHLALPHWENENVAVSGDGKRVIITYDDLSGAEPMMVIDTSIPQAPIIVSRTDVGSHTVSCVDYRCDWVYATTGATYDLRNPAEPNILNGTAGWMYHVEKQAGPLYQSVHAFSRDAAGFLHVDSVPRVMLDVSKPKSPKVKADSSYFVNFAGDTAYQHNNLRPDADKWKARSNSWSGGDLKAGELLLATGETNFTWLAPTRFPPTIDEPGITTDTCDGYSNGPFSTWRMADWNRGRTFVPIEVFRPVNSNMDHLPDDGKNRPWLDGNPDLNAVGCSGHWFDALGAKNGKIFVAAGWYDHGTRILQVNRKNGDIKEVGFFQPGATSTWSALWASNDVIYTIDAVRGIDILRFHRKGPYPTVSELFDSWTGPTDPMAAAITEVAQQYCTLAIKPS